MRTHEGAIRKAWTKTTGRAHERSSSASQGQRLQKKPNLQTLWPWTSSLQDCKKTIFLLFKPPRATNKPLLLKKKKFYGPKNSMALVYEEELEDEKLTGFILNIWAMTSLHLHTHTHKCGLHESSNLYETSELLATL